MVMKFNFYLLMLYFDVILSFRMKGIPMKPSFVYRNRRLLWGLLVGAGLIAVMSADLDLTAYAQTPVGRDLASKCFQCHGTNGRPVEGMPKIAGKDASSLYQTMLEYKETGEGDVNDDIMVPVARAYTNQQLWEMALYIASLPEEE